MTLVEEMDNLYKSLKIGLDRTPQGLCEELDYRSQWLARSAEILADCQLLLDMKRGEVAETFIGTNESWNVVKMLIESKTKDERRLFLLAERLNATITHQIDAVRSLLSFEKESAKLGGHL
jgi:hypothetical protein